MSHPNEERVLRPIALADVDAPGDFVALDEIDGDEVDGVAGLEGVGEDDVEAMASLFASTEFAAHDELATARLARFARESALPRRKPRFAWQLQVAGVALAAGLGWLALRPSPPAPVSAAEVALVEGGTAGDADWTGADPLDFFGTSATYAQADLLPDELGAGW